MKRRERVTVLGSGGWGTAIAHLCANAGPEVWLLGRDAGLLDAIASLRRNDRYLAGLQLAAGIRMEAVLAKAIDKADIILGCAPTQHTRSTLAVHRERLAGKLYVNTAKGIETGTTLRVSEIPKAEAPETRDRAIVTKRRCDDGEHRQLPVERYRRMEFHRGTPEPELGPGIQVPAKLNDRRVHQQHSGAGNLQSMWRHQQLRLVAANRRTELPLRDAVENLLEDGTVMHGPSSIAWRCLNNRSMRGSRVLAISRRATSNRTAVARHPLVRKAAGGG